METREQKKFSLNKPRGGGGGGGAFLDPETLFVSVHLVRLYIKYQGSRP